MCILKRAVLGRRGFYMSRIEENRRKEELQIEEQKRSRQQADMKKKALFQAALKASETQSNQAQKKTFPPQNKSPETLRNASVQRSKKEKTQENFGASLKNEDKPKELKKGASSVEKKNKEFEKNEEARSDLLYENAIKREQNPSSQQEFSQGQERQFPVEAMLVSPFSSAAGSAPQRMEVANKMHELVEHMLSRIEEKEKDGLSSLNIELGAEFGGGNILFSTDTDQRIVLEFVGLNTHLTAALQGRRQELRNRLERKGYQLGGIRFK